jgi:hypothetical protein
MAEVKPDDLFVSTEEEVEVDAETAAEIELGIKDADEGRTFSLDEVRKMIPEWISKSSTPNRCERSGSGHTTVVVGVSRAGRIAGMGCGVLPERPLRDRLGFALNCVFHSVKAPPPFDNPHRRGADVSISNRPSCTALSRKLPWIPDARGPDFR